MWKTFLAWGIIGVFSPLITFLSFRNWLVVAILETVVAGALVYSATVLLRWCEYERRFREIFVNPDRVNEVLTERARSFAGVCAKEADLQKHGYKQNVFEDPEKGLENIQKRISTQKAHLLIQKGRFWEAHGLAKKLDYRVSPSHKDYLAEFAESPKPAA